MGIDPVVVNWLCATVRCLRHRLEQLEGHRRPEPVSGSSTVQTQKAFVPSYGEPPRTTDTTTSSPLLRSPTRTTDNAPPISPFQSLTNYTDPSSFIAPLETRGNASTPTVMQTQLARANSDTESPRKTESVSESSMPELPTSSTVPSNTPGKASASSAAQNQLVRPEIRATVRDTCNTRAECWSAGPLPGIRATVSISQKIIEDFIERYPMDSCASGYLKAHPPLVQERVINTFKPKKQVADFSGMVMHLIELWSLRIYGAEIRTRPTPKSPTIPADGSSLGPSSSTPRFSPGTATTAPSSHASRAPARTAETAPSLSTTRSLTRKTDPVNSSSLSKSPSSSTSKPPPRTAETVPLTSTSRSPRRTTGPAPSSPPSTSPMSFTSRSPPRTAETAPSSLVSRSPPRTAGTAPLSSASRSPTAPPSSASKSPKSSFLKSPSMPPPNLPTSSYREQGSTAQQLNASAPDVIPTLSRVCVLVEARRGPPSQLNVDAPEFIPSQMGELF